MKNPEPEKVREVMGLAQKYNLECDIFYHEQSGKTTEDAQKALGIDSKQIIKCLLLKSRDNKYLGAILRGSDKLDFSVLEHLSGYKSLRMASKEEIERELGFEIGGVPALIFREKNIATYVDERVLSLEHVVGSGGTSYYGMKFNPRVLTDRLGYSIANMIKQGVQNG